VKVLRRFSWSSGRQRVHGSRHSIRFARLEFEAMTTRHSAVRIATFDREAFADERRLVAGACAGDEYRAVM